jgi:uncharacterized protein
MKFFGLIFSCILFFTIAAYADDTATLNGLLALANKGDAEAQYHVGMMYNNGIGTPQDPQQAFQWFQKSAAGNDPLGAYKLGCYYAGQFAGVVKVDEVAELKYKLAAAKAGYSLAQHDVAVIYYRQGNSKETIKWLKSASDQGYDMSFYGLASSYHEGMGVPKNIPLAFAYYKLALLASETALSDGNKAVMDEMIAQMSEAELENAQKIVAEWKPKPTALTLRAKEGFSAAEVYLQKSK